MTARHHPSGRPDKPWMHSLQQELDRVMERERQFRASIREERLSHLDRQLANSIPTHQTAPKSLVS